MKKTSKGQTTGAGNPGWGDSENLDATRALHPSDDAPTTAFSSDATEVLSDYQDPTQVLSDYQDPTEVLSDYQDPTEVLNSHETATPAAGHSDDRTKVLTDYGSSPANDGLYINGVRINVRGVNRHSFRPESGRTLSNLSSTGLSR